MICPKCGKDISDDVKFCPDCGFTIWAMQPEAAQQEVSPSEPAAQSSQSPYVPAPQSAAGTEAAATAEPKQGGSKTGLIIGIIVALIAAAAAAVVLFVHPGYLVQTKSEQPAEPVAVQAPAPVVEEPQEEVAQPEPEAESEEPEEEPEQKTEEEEETSLDIKEISVYDEADILSSSEEKELSEMIAKYESETGWKILFVSAEGIKANGTELYAEDRYDDMYGIGTDGLILLIDLDNRMIWLSSYREPERYLSGENIDTILYMAEDDLKDEKYGKAAMQIIRNCAELKLSATKDHSLKGNPSLEDYLWLSDGAINPDEENEDLNSMNFPEMWTGTWEVLILSETDYSKLKKVDDFAPYAERLATLDITLEDGGKAVYNPYQFLAEGQGSEDSGYTIDFEPSYNFDSKSAWYADGYFMECNFWQDDNGQHSMGEFMWPDGEESVIILTRP